MESYVEISYIQNVFCTISALLFAQYTTLRPIRIRSMIVYACSTSFCICFLWIPYHLLILFLWEVLCIFWLFRHAKKTYIWMQCFSYLQQFTLFLLFSGGFYNLHWFVPITMYILPLWLFYICIWVLLWCKWNRWIARNTCIYQTTIYIGQHTLQYKGYLDSGNLLTEQGIPVVFLDCCFDSYFQNENICYIDMVGVDNSQKIACIKGEIQLQGCKRHTVYICTSNSLQLPNGCRLLLNMNLMTMG